MFDGVTELLRFHHEMSKLSLLHDDSSARAATYLPLYNNEPRTSLHLALPTNFPSTSNPEAEAMMVSQRWDKLEGKDMPTHYGVLSCGQTLSQVRAQRATQVPVEKCGRHNFCL